MQVHGMEGLKAAVETESTSRKCFIAIASIVAFVCAAVIGGIYIAWYANVREIQDSFENLCD